MKYIIISLPFIVLIPILKLLISKQVEPEIYALFGTVWGMASFFGGQIFGLYPQLMPNDINQKQIIKTDNLSVFISAGMLAFYSWYHDLNVFVLFSCILCSILSGFYDLFTIKGSILKNRNLIFFSEIINLAPLFIIIFLVSISGYNDKKLFLSYAIVIVIVSFYIRKYKIEFIKLHRNNKDYFFSKLGVTFCQASFYLLPFIMTFRYEASFVGEFLVIFYIVNLPLSLNQMIVRRLYYSTPRYDFNYLFVIILGIMLESYAIFLVVNHKLLDFIIPTNVVLNFSAIFLMFVGRFLYSIYFIRSRAMAVEGKYTIYVELLRFILLIGLLNVYVINDVNIVFYILALCFFIASSIYAYLSKSY